MSPSQLANFLAQAASLPNHVGQQRNTLFNHPSPQPAAVLLAIVLRQQQWQILLTRRANTLRHHTGQIALAGGRCDPEDQNPTATALREAHEEVGIAPEHWQTFPTLTPYQTPSGYAVYPVPALSLHNPTTQANASEVAEIFYLPLEFALNLNHYSRRELHHNQHTFQAPTLPYLHYDIWGLTAIILYDLAERLAQFQKAV